MIDVLDLVHRENFRTVNSLLTDYHRSCCLAHPNKNQLIDVGDWNKMTVLMMALNSLLTIAMSFLLLDFTTEAAGSFQTSKHLM